MVLLREMSIRFVMTEAPGKDPEPPDDELRIVIDVRRCHDVLQRRML